MCKSRGVSVLGQFRQHNGLGLTASALIEANLLSNIRHYRAFEHKNDENVNALQHVNGIGEIPENFIHVKVRY